MRPTILHSCIFIHDLRGGRYQRQIDALRGPVRTSAIVLAELLRDARRPEEQRFVKKLGENHPVLAPTINNWIESGEVLAKMREDRGLSADRVRTLHFDLLIALTARSIGAADYVQSRRLRDDSFLS